MEENLIYKIEILQLIESKYKIEIKDEEVENLDTIENLINLIKERI
jgi:acyl carrier protein